MSKSKVNKQGKRIEYNENDACGNWTASFRSVIALPSVKAVLAKTGPTLLVKGNCSF